jgi:hypothetical protein
LDSAGNIYIADNNNNRIRRIAAATQTITTFTTFGGRAIVSDGADGFLISSSSQIQHVFADGTATLIAGIGFGFAGDGGSSLMAPISAQTLAFAPSSGKIYFGDNFDNVVRQLAPISGGAALMSASVAGINSRLGHAASTTVTFNVALNGTGAFTWSASTSIATGPAGSQWLTVPPGTSGTRGDPIAVTVSAFGLPLGVYNGSVTITSPQATNSPLVLPVTLTVLPSIINTGSTSITASANVGGPNPAAQAFAVTNGGSGVSFAVNAAAQIATPPGGTWLTVSPGTGNTGSLSLTESFQHFSTRFRNLQRSSEHYIGAGRELAGDYSCDLDGESHRGANVIVDRPYNRNPGRHRVGVVDRREFSSRRQHNKPFRIRNYGRNGRIAERHVALHHVHDCGQRCGR